MLKIDQTYIEKNGGLLHSIRKKSNRYIKALLEENGCIKPLDINVNKLDRTIVHTDPHLDEYFADLMFRSVLPDVKLDIDFMEMSIHSKTNDSSCMAYWPNAAVMGIGGAAAGNIKPLLLFDEHLEQGRRSDESCSQMVVNETLYPGIPVSIHQLLKEVNEIDAFGKAHDQHIGNIIKTAHVVRLQTSQKDVQENITHDFMNPEWKKSLMDAMITSIIYCLEHKINLHDFPKSKDSILRDSFEYFLSHCSYTDDSFFKATTDRIKNIYFNQTIVFKDAKLPNSRKTDQLLILGRVCFALEKCWGKSISKIVMMHIWEVLYLGQLCFNKVSHEIKPFALKNGRFKNDYGEFEKRLVPANNTTRKSDIWILSVNQNPNLIKGNRPLMNLINKHNDGHGIIIINDDFQCTKSIFKCKGFDQSLWELMVDTVVTIEPDHWHVIHTNDGAYVPFILNGNKSHRYLQHSSISIHEIERIVKEIL